MKLMIDVIIPIVFVIVGFFFGCKMGYEVGYRKGTKHEIDKEKALRIACELINGGFIYGIDTDVLFAKIMEKDGVVCAYDYEDFILENLDRFSDNDNIRERAIKRLGW